MKLVLGAVVALAGVSSVAGYAQIVPPGCDAESTCTEFVGGLDFAAEVDENNTVIKCKFGQTSNESAAGEFCELPCNEDVSFSCVCVSESDAQAGLDVEAQFAQLLGMLFIFALVPIFAFQCYRRKAYYKKAEAYEAAYEEADGKTDKIALLPPNAPQEWFIWPAYLVLLILSIVYFAQMASIKNRGFWTGCGDEDDLVPDDA